MCMKKPGKRCSNYYRRQLDRSVERHHALDTPETLAAVERAQAEFDATMKGYKELKSMAAQGEDVHARYVAATTARGKSYDQRVLALVPRESNGQYYAQNDAKHFGRGGTAGSRFTGDGIDATEDVLVLAYQQRGTLEGDDRDVFITNDGASPDAFFEGCRYLKVHTPGLSGVLSSQFLDDGDLIHVRRDKVGAPCSLSADAKPGANEVNSGCIIIGPSPDGGERVYSAFPGPVTVPGSGEMDAYEGQSLPVWQVREIFGQDVHVLLKVN